MSDCFKRKFAARFLNAFKIPATQDQDPGKFTRKLGISEDFKTFQKLHHKLSFATLSEMLSEVLSQYTEHTLYKDPVVVPHHREQRDGVGNNLCTDICPFYEHLEHDNI